MCQIIFFSQRDETCVCDPNKTHKTQMKIIYCWKYQYYCDPQLNIAYTWEVLKYISALMGCWNVWELHGKAKIISPDIG